MGLNSGRDLCLTDVAGKVVKEAVAQAQDGRASSLIARRLLPRWP